MKSITKEMRDTLKNLYEEKNKNMKMDHNDKLHGARIAKEESVPPYLSWVAHVKHEIAIAKEVISNSKLVQIALKGFTKEWDVFVKCVMRREELPDLSKLWDDFTQEKIWEGSQSRN